MSRAGRRRARCSGWATPSRSQPAQGGRLAHPPAGAGGEGVAESLVPRGSAPGPCPGVGLGAGLKACPEDSPCCLAATGTGGCSAAQSPAPGRDAASRGGWGGTPLSPPCDVSPLDPCQPQDAERCWGWWHSVGAGGRGGGKVRWPSAPTPSPLCAAASAAGVAVAVVAVAGVAGSGAAAVGAGAGGKEHGWCD